MKNLKTIILAGLLALSCGGSGGNTGVNPSETVSTKTILASNVVFKSSSSTASLLVGSANAEEIDTTTKVYAENVILDNADTALSSTNVQDAFVETQPDLATAIVGTWNIYQLGGGNGRDEDGTENDFGVDIGTVTFNSDNTFSYIMNYSTEENWNPFNVIELNKNLMVSNPVQDYKVSSNMVVLIRLKGIYDYNDDYYGDSPHEKDGQVYSQINPLMVIKSQGGAYLFYDTMNHGIYIFTKVTE